MCEELTKAKDFEGFYNYYFTDGFYTTEVRKLLEDPILIYSDENNPRCSIWKYNKFKIYCNLGKEEKLIVSNVDGICHQYIPISGDALDCDNENARNLVLEIFPIMRTRYIQGPY